MDVPVAILVPLYSILESWPTLRPFLDYMDKSPTPIITVLFSHLLAELDRLWSSGIELILLRDDRDLFQRLVAGSEE